MFMHRHVSQQLSRFCREVGWSLPMSGGAIPAKKYKSSTYVGLRHPVTARHGLFSSGSSMSAYVDLDHIGAAYSAIEYHSASAIVLIVLAFVLS